MPRKVMELTRDEIELIREALSMLRDAPPVELRNPALLFGSWLQAEQNGNLEEWMRETEQKISQDYESLQDRIDLLSAKLVQMKDSLTAREIVSGF